MKQLFSAIQKHPIRSLLLIALLPRLLAVVFSQGYGMHDDHFGPIEQPHIIFHDISYWENRGGVHGHSIVYPSLHYGLFFALREMNIVDPKDVMFIVRLLHALYSLLIVYFGYKIVRFYSSPEIAWKTGILLALFWPLPFISVRNLIEVVCIPPLMAGTYYALRAEEHKKYTLWAGVFFAIAFVFRYQTILIPATIVLIWLWQKQWRFVLRMFITGFVTAFCIQGTADILAWGYPFAAVLEYIRYNATHSTDYTTGGWFNYLFLLLGAFIPPTSFFLLYGCARQWKKASLLFFSSLTFFIFLSSFPNKQERFVFSVVPQIFLLSAMGWLEATEVSAFWQRHKRVVRGLWIWFWIVNTVLLLLFSTYYSKRARAEAMYYFYGKPVSGYVLVAGDVGVTQMPQFYSGQYTKTLYEIHNTEEVEAIANRILTENKSPNYVLFFGPQALEKKEKLEHALGKNLKYEATISPSFLDDVFYRLNPRYNKNQTIFIYRIE